MIKTIIVLELMTLLMCAIGHFVLYIAGINFPMNTYWIVPLIVLGCILLSAIITLILERL